MSLPWSRWAAIPFAMFTVALTASFWPDRGNPLALLWFGLPAALGYTTVALLFNTTSLSVKDACLVARHGPVPWPGRRVPAQIIERVDAVPRSSADTTTTTTWDLVVTLQDRRTVRLTGGLMAGHRFDLVANAAGALAASLERSSS